MNKQEHLLTILMEECCELAQETSKAKRFGVHEQRDLPTSNHERMQKEYNDILAAVDLLNDDGLNLHRDEALIAAKREKVARYLEYSRQRGTLDAPPIPEGCSVVGDNVLRFLHGMGPIFGRWFHEHEEKESGKYWWRKYLPRPTKPKSEGEES